MKKYLPKISLLIVILLFTYCAITPPPTLTKKEQSIRIGIIDRASIVTFLAEKPFSVFDHNGNLIASNISGQKWNVKLNYASPAQIKYRLVCNEFFAKDEAEQYAGSLIEAGYQISMQQVKKKMTHKNKFGTTILYRILLKEKFDTETEAQAAQKSNNQIRTTILPFFETPPLGQILLFNEETGRQFASEKVLKIRGEEFKINVKVGEGYHFEREDVRSYRGDLEFVIDRFGSLTVVNELSVEEYLYGVVGSEMQSRFPIEALKAQAVTARGFTLATIGNTHRLDPYDLCDEVHCHVYGGIDREAPAVKQAVDQTRGTVLMYENQICDTYYAGVCGGHTEHNENVWNGNPKSYLRGVFDSQHQNYSDNYLQNEDNVRKWINSSPVVFCNMTLNPVPEYLEYTKKYFRWQVLYSREELSNIVKSKTGENIGLVRSIIPLERGVSGRLKKIQIVGTQKSITVEKELSIRNALSSSYLYSACFYVEQVGNNFIIKGAGWGHGVGMCQTGAAMMALNGYDFRQILSHYYKNSKLEKLY